MVILTLNTLLIEVKVELKVMKISIKVIRNNNLIKISIVITSEIV